MQALRPTSTGAVPIATSPVGGAIDVVIRSFRAIDTRLLIFMLLVGNYASTRLTTNEEMYLPMALQFVDPAWIPNSFSFTEFAGTRGLFQLIVGPVLEFVPFEWVAFFGRAAMYAIYCFPLAAIFEYFGLSNIAVLLVLQLVLKKYQTFFGGEWLFQGFETKAVAYAFVFFAYAAFVRKRYALTVCWLIAASYFHILVGGWISVAFFVFLLVERVPLNRLARYGLLYLAAVGPYVLYLLAGTDTSGPKVVDGVSIDWIYTYFRNPHHTVVFHNGWSFFVGTRLRGILAVITCLIASAICLAKRYRIEYAHVLKLNIVMYAMVLCFVVVAWFDREGAVLKYYLFRINAFAFFSTVLLAAACLARLSIPAWASRAGALLVLVGCTGYFVSTAAKDVHLMRADDRPYDRMLDRIVASTPPAAIFVFDPNDKQFLDFSRRTRRDEYVSWKVEPSGGSKLLAWYARLKQADAIDQDPNRLDELAGRLHIDYFLTRKEYPHFKRAPLYVYGPYRLYRLDQPPAT